MNRRLLQITLDRDDPYEGRVAALVDHLQHGARGALKLWLLKQFLRLGPGDAGVMAARLKEDLMGGDTLEDGHQRDQGRAAPLGKPEQPAPLGKPPPSEPLHKPLPDDDLVKRRRHDDHDDHDEESSLLL